MRSSCLATFAALSLVAAGHHGARAERVSTGPATAASPAAANRVEPATPPRLDPADVLSLTRDPVLGASDRVDGDEARGVVTFTFDDGPNPDTTPAVIAALEKYDVPATFFVVTRRLVGTQGQKARELLAREIAAGFEIGSHSVSHPSLKAASAKVLAREIDGSLRTLAPQANRPIGLFRPPFGAFSKTGARHLQKLGLTDVRWSVDTLDWQAKHAGRLRAKVLKMIVKQRGGVVLMHDVKAITAQIIDGVLDDLEAENCRRLVAAEEPIVPVSLHYFLKDGKTPRPLPDAVVRRTAAYRAALPARCARRPAPVPASAVTPAAAPAR